jgi:hypothetical protein
LTAPPDDGDGLLDLVDGIFTGAVDPLFGA